MTNRRAERARANHDHVRDHVGVQLQVLIKFELFRNWIPTPYARQFFLLASDEFITLAKSYAEQQPTSTQRKYIFSHQMEKTDHSNKCNQRIC